MKVCITKEIEDRPKWKVGAVISVTMDYGRQLILSGHANAVGDWNKTDSEKTLAEHFPADADEAPAQKKPKGKEEPKGESESASTENP